MGIFPPAEASPPAPERLDRLAVPRGVTRRVPRGATVAEAVMQSLGLQCSTKPLHDGLHFARLVTAWVPGGYPVGTRALKVSAGYALSP